MSRPPKVSSLWYPKTLSSDFVRTGKKKKKAETNRTKTGEFCIQWEEKNVKKVTPAPIVISGDRESSWSSRSSSHRK